MSARWAWAVACPVLWLAGCGGTGEERFAEFSFDGQCGQLHLWRAATVTPVVRGAEDLRCELIEGRLPSGMSLDPQTCIISGTPLQLEVQWFWVRATASNVNGHADRSCTLQVLGPAIAYGAALASDTPHLPGDQFWELPSYAGHPESPWTLGAGESLLYEVAPGYSLPPGLTLDPSTGAIAGTLGWDQPWEDEWWTFVVRVTATGPLATIQDSSWATVFVRLPYSVYDLPGSSVGSIGTPLTIAPTLTPAALDASSWEYFLDAWHFSVEARLPAGLSLDPTSGTISGTPSEPDNVLTGITFAVTRNGVTFELHDSVQIYVPAN